MSIKYQRPRKLEVETLTPNYGKFFAEPFERGYGTTIGIALRRVLHSLIEGAAITAVRIQGALHEFSILPGVYEDVLNVILNLKTIPIQLNVEETKLVRLDKEGPGEVLSGDILHDDSVEILNPNIHIVHLEKNTKFQAELVIKKGVGFKLADQNFDDTLAVDFIPMDANFNPIEKVNYAILPSRVGKTTDYEKLVIEVWTNGSVSPKDAMARAGKILRDHLAIFLDFPDKEKVRGAGEPESGAGLENKAEFLERSVDTLGLSVRALKCLKKLGVNWVFELVEKTEHELLNSKNFGKKSLEEILLKLSEFELTLGQKITDQMKKELQEKFHHKDLTVVEAEE